ncbi:Zinc finger RING/FYVE/PHD-type protein [Dioscorea alata]|uniref:Zinc finger RING/FYVE/PHD-type protein n=1 Tax=Dioscorea alata TaxID=55571 RepID=A0ACB7VPH5_DIOAL|nr:Zinc finger RING/FYVE/PHD-type protein [Dioscorea alata]
MESDSWSRFAAAVASKRHQHAQQSRHDMYLGFEEIDAGDDEASRAEYACPFCGEDFDIVGLCCHIDEEHPIEARTGVLNSLIGNYMQRRRRLRKDSSGSHSTISLLRKELREGNLQALLGGSSYSIPPAAPDPFLSSLIYTLPASDSLRDSQPGHLDGGNITLTAKCSDEKAVERSSNIEPSLSDKDQKERARRSEFVRGLVLSTIFEETL